MIVVRLLLSARRVTATLLIFVSLIAPTRPGVAQIATPGVWEAGRQAPVVSGSLQAQQIPRVFMPLVSSVPDVKIQFGTGVDSQDKLINPGTVFAYGIARLYYRYTVTGALNRLYRTEWLVDGVRQPQLDDSGTILEASAVLTNSFCSTTLSSCDQPVPRGSYRVRFYIEDVFYQEATAVVQ